MPRAVFTWRNCATNKKLYGKLRSVISALQESRLVFISDAWRRKVEIIIQTLLWSPIERIRKRIIYQYLLM